MKDWFSWWCFPNEEYVKEWSKWGKFSAEFFEIEQSVGDDGMFESYESSCGDVATVTWCIQEAEFLMVVLKVSFCIWVIFPFELSWFETLPET